MLFRRRTSSRLTYWFQALGFNPRDRSCSNLLYFGYFCAFWIAWAVAVCAMLGAGLARSFEFFPAASPSNLAVQLSAIILVSWGLFELWQVTGHSPFVFSESDAYLLCQTPVHRRSVALAWFLMDWFGTAFFFAVGAIVFSFALTDIALSDMASFQRLPSYFASSLRSLIVILPLQMGLQAGMYGLGALRLRRDRPPGKRFWLRLAALPLGLGFVAALFSPDWTIILTPLTFPLQAAYVNGLLPDAWLIRAGLAWLVLALGMAGLLVWTDRMHLGQAAQETRLEATIRLARGVMNYELVEILQRQNKMKATRPPSRLPIRRGVWMIIWQNLVQWSRSLRAAQVMHWALVVFLSLGAFLSSDWVVQLVLGGLWAVSLGSLATDRLRSNLARWWLLRSLPLQNAKIILSLLAPAWGIGVLLSWLALALTGTSLGWLAAALLPFLAACAALGSTLDIISHAKARVLMMPGLAEENVPHQDIQGVLIILIAVGLPLGLLTWSSSHPGGLIWGLFSLPIAGLITFLLFRIVLLTYRMLK